MGHKIDWGFNKDSILYMPQGKGNATNNSVVIGLDKLEFHTSWDWLMPVVRKIVEISCNENEDAFLSDEYTSILETTPLAIIEDTYKAVVEFIKWYNENK
jgi:hypothetical protein